ncbi:GAP family protein [Nocardia sp. NBC_01388]|uniref:GAP family protein n=1 Tax=Nocardia sp. NBC_01388 TaxID=2903596 RepID=UPI003244F7EF
MGSVIGDLLPLAVGVAISPIPIVAVILMLLSRNASGAGTGFATGWVVGLLIATGVFLLLSGSIDNSHSSDPKPAVSWVRIALGVLLLALAVKQWRSRTDTSAPGWMQALDSVTFVKAAGLGFALSAVNPKNLLLCVSAGVAIGTGGLSGPAEVGAVLIYTALAATTVLVPAIGYRLAADRVRGSLESLKNWLQANNHMVMAIVMLVMGAVVLGKGIGGL